MYLVASEILGGAVDHMKEGQSFGDLASAIRGELSKNNLASNITQHEFGHSIGIELTERPLVVESDTTQMLQGMCVALTLHLSGKFGSAIAGNTYLVGKKRGTALCSSPSIENDTILARK